MKDLPELTTEQEIKLKDNIKGFREYAKTMEFQKGATERAQRKAMFEAITPEKLKSLTEYEFGIHKALIVLSLLWYQRGRKCGKNSFTKSASFSGARPRLSSPSG